MLTAATFSAAALVKRFSRLTPRSLGTIAVATSLCLAGYMVQDRPFGWRDQWHYGAGYFIFLLAMFGTSAGVWWKVATWPAAATGTDTQYVDADSIQR